jgi:hypothetical protein
MTDASAVTQTSVLAATDAGMHTLWNPSRFTSITSYETWEDALLEDDDITAHVRAGELVPINIGGDGAFQFLIRVGTQGPRPRANQPREPAPAGLLAALPLPVRRQRLPHRHRAHPRRPRPGRPRSDDSGRPERRHHPPHRPGLRTWRWGGSWTGSIRGPARLRGPDQPCKHDRRSLPHPAADLRPQLTHRAVYHPGARREVQHRRNSTRLTFDGKRPPGFANS